MLFSHRDVFSVAFLGLVILIGSIIKDSPPPHPMLCDATVDRVTTLKLLWFHVSSNLKWTDHVYAMVSNAASRLYFLEQLNRAGAPIRDLLHFYTAAGP